MYPKLPLKLEAPENILYIFVTMLTSHCDKSPLKLSAPLNILCVSLTLTSHSDRLLLKSVCPKNMYDMTLRDDVFHPLRIVTRIPPVRLDKYGVILSDLGALVVWSIWRACLMLTKTPVCPTI